MRVFVYALIISSFSFHAFAKTEKLKIIKADDFDDYAIVEDESYDKWHLELGIGCRLEKYEGKFVIGDYIIDPDSPGAKIITPDGDECKIWNATEL